MEEKDEKLILADEKVYDDEPVDLVELDNKRKAEAKAEAKVEKSLEKEEKKELKKQREESKSVGRIIFEYARVIIIAIIVAVLLCNFVIINAVVPSGSMESTINKGDRLIGWRLAYKFSEPKRGDIAIFKCPEAGAEYGKLYIKRIIGLPGETVRISEGKIYIIDKNGVQSSAPLDEDYLKTGSLENPIYSSATYNNKDYVLGDDEYFFMGDNRDHSHDSRFFGPVSKSKIVAKAGFRYWKGFKSL